MSDPVEIKRFGGASVFYTDAGSGVPLLFIHGWLMSQRVWALQSPLTDKFRVLTLDLRGHGSAGDSAFSYSDCCADIALLLDRLRLDRVILVGWSMGAQIAIKTCRTLSEKIVGMVLVGATPHFCCSDDFPFGVSPVEVRSMVLRIKKDYLRTCGEFFRSMFSPQDAVQVDMRLLATKVVGRLPSRETALAALDELMRCDLRTDLPLIAAPVLLVHGVDDKICLPGASKFMAEMITEASLTLLPSVGHAPFLTDPESFNRTLCDFVQVVHG